MRDGKRSAPLVALSAMALLSGCGLADFDRCVRPRVTEFPRSMQEQARAEMAGLPPGAVLPDMMDAMAADRAYNRALCPE